MTNKTNIILTLLILTLIGCSDDDSFTTSTANMLRFSSDTINMDTVFSHVPTATKTFWAYNKSGDGIRCTNVRLENGNQSGFRVNVDGTYLGEASGYQTNNVEIRNKDSIRVFVELTSPFNHNDVPQKITDNIVFSLESGVKQYVNLKAMSWDALSVNNLEIKKDTTISGTKPIIVYGGIKVDSGATLTIAQGTTLYFHDKAGIDVYGKLLCKGEVNNNIVFRGDRLDRMFDYLPYDNVSGQWKGIHFYDSSYDNVIDNTDIHSACDGIVCDSSDVNKSKLKLINSILHNSKGNCLLSYSSSIDVENCQITNSLNDCVAIYGGKTYFLHNTIAQFYPFDSNRGYALRFCNYLNDSLYPLYDFHCINTLITGYSDDVLLGQTKDSVTAFSYCFDNCLLRTPEMEKDTVKLINVLWEDVKDTTTTGIKNFIKIDTDNLRYDFRLDSISKAINAGNPKSSLDYDRLGIRRDDKPDIGCYEYK